MGNSPEYPDLKWVEPKSWSNSNRTAVQLIVIHDTEGSSHTQSAEDGAAYDARRTDGTSAHYFVDSNSVVQCVTTADQAHTARTQGNKRGIHYELCAKASFTQSKWLSADYGLPMLRLAAKQAARDCKKWGIPARKLTPGQVADGVKGFCGHGDITKAFPQDNGTHTDPGPNFPWDQFIDMVRDILDPPEEESMSAADVQNLTKAITAMEGRLKAEIDKVAAEVMNAKVGSKSVPTRMVKQGLGDLFNQIRPWLWLSPNHPERLEAKPQAGSVIDYLANKLPAEIASIKASVAKAEQKP